MTLEDISIHCGRTSATQTVLTIIDFNRYSKSLEVYQKCHKLEGHENFCKNLVPARCSVENKSCVKSQLHQNINTTKIISF